MCLDDRKVTDTSTSTMVVSVTRNSHEENKVFSQNPHWIGFEVQNPALKRHRTTWDTKIELRSTRDIFDESIRTRSRIGV